MNGALGERGITTWNMVEFLRRDCRATFLFLDSSELVRYELSIGVVLTCFERLRMAYRNEIQSVVSFASCYCFVGDSKKKKERRFRSFAASGRQETEAFGSWPSLLNFSSHSPSLLCLGRSPEVGRWNF